jgi:formate dehydrogenase iron-sulfur subunit
MMTPIDDKDATPVKSTLIDITNCIGCRACQVACKQWNERDGEATEFEARPRLPEPGRIEREDLHSDLVPTSSTTTANPAT